MQLKYFLHSQTEYFNGLEAWSQIGKTFYYVNNGSAIHQDPFYKLPLKVYAVQKAPEFRGFEIVGTIGDSIVGYETWVLSKSMFDFSFTPYPPDNQSPVLITDLIPYMGKSGVLRYPLSGYPKGTYFEVLDTVSLVQYECQHTLKSQPIYNDTHIDNKVVDITTARRRQSEQKTNECLHLARQRYNIDIESHGFLQVLLDNQSIEHLGSEHISNVLIFR